MIKIIDENGNEIDFLAERNEEIKVKLQDTLNDFLAEKEKNPYVKLGYRWNMQLHAVFCTYRPLTATQVAQIDYDILNDYWVKYLDLLSYYNRYFTVPTNKQEFFAYAGIDDRIFEQFKASSDEKLSRLAWKIDDEVVAFGFFESESGEASAAAVKLRLSAKGVGHSVVSAGEEMAAKAIAGQSPQELQKEIAAITGTIIDMKKIK